MAHPKSGGRNQEEGGCTRRSRERMLKLQQSWARHRVWPQLARKCIGKVNFHYAQSLSNCCRVPRTRYLQLFLLPLPPCRACYFVCQRIFLRGHVKNRPCGFWNVIKRRFEECSRVCCIAAAAADLAAQFEILKWFFG